MQVTAAAQWLGLETNWEAQQAQEEAERLDGAGIEEGTVVRESAEHHAAASVRRKARHDALQHAESEHKRMIAAAARREATKESSDLTSLFSQKQAQQEANELVAELSVEQTPGFTVAEVSCFVNCSY